MDTIVEEFTTEWPILKIAMLTHAERTGNFKIRQFLNLSTLCT